MAKRDELRTIRQDYHERWMNHHKECTSCLLGIECDIARQIRADQEIATQTLLNR